MNPLTDAEILAAQAKQAQRTQDLRNRGWQQTTPITRAELADWTLDRWLRKNGRTA